jgi:mannose-6-phosphate isomerase-like protein (cupin superfamily)
MRLITKKDQNVIDTHTCGILTEICFTRKSLTGITQAQNIKPTTPHYHKQQTELFWVDKGEVTIKVESDGKVTETKVCEGEVLCIEPGEIHSITKASEVNRLILISTPAWTKDDEFVV